MSDVTERQPNTDTPSTFTFEQLRDDGATRARLCAVLGQLTREANIVLRRKANSKDYEFIQTQLL